LGLGLEAKTIEEDIIWNLMILEIIARLDIIAELGQVVIALERERVYEINNILLLKLEKHRRKKRDFAFFPVLFVNN